MDYATCYIKCSISKKEFPEAYQKKVSLIAKRKEIPVKKHQLNYNTR